MKINFGDGTLKGDLTAAQKLAVMDGQTSAAELYERARERIDELESEIADLHEGRSAVLPNDRKHAEAMYTIANAFLESRMK